MARREYDTYSCMHLLVPTRDSLKADIECKAVSLQAKALDVHEKLW